MMRQQTRNKLPKTVAGHADDRAAGALEAWRLRAIMSEFVETTARSRICCIRLARASFRDL